MTRDLIFWVLMLIWFVFGMVINFGGQGALGGYAHVSALADQMLGFILFLLLGWQVYGPPVHG
jgi:hypothetical protein